MKYIPKYYARRVKDDAIVEGYPAISSEGGCAWMLIPVHGTDDQFHIVEVDGDSIEKME